jgi:hypothetical protein
MAFHFDKCRGLFYQAVAIRSWKFLDRELIHHHMTAVAHEGFDAFPFAVLDLAQICNLFSPSSLEQGVQLLLGWEF